VRRVAAGLHASAQLSEHLSGMKKEPAALSSNAVKRSQTSNFGMCFCVVVDFTSMFPSKLCSVGAQTPQIAFVANEKNMFF
jgi:hypothetical protein